MTGGRAREIWLKSNERLRQRLVKIPNLFRMFSVHPVVPDISTKQYQHVTGLARSLQSLWHRRPDGPDRQVQGMKIMSLRFENAQRLAFSLVGALMFTVVMFSAAVSVGPVA
ncbi:hypothetical protein GCM10009087_56910 [Sphingomonas oligophenolica]